MVSIFFAILVIVGITWLIKNQNSLKGRIGEARVKDTLSNLDKNKYKVFHDLVIPTSNGKTSQIDHIVLSYKGIFVNRNKKLRRLDSRNWSHQYWTQVIYKRKEKFYNPIFQNYGHIKALKDYLGKSADSLPFISVIVFGNQAEQKTKHLLLKLK